MGHEIEIEYKNLLTEDEFHLLLKTFSIAEHDFFLQENHYFDTQDFQLKDLGSALRIRYKDLQYQLTLKQPIPEGLLETNQNISEEDVTRMIHEQIFPRGEVLEEIKKLEIQIDSLEHFGTLSTKRAEVNYKNGLLVFDYSFYLNNEDYELEYEVQNKDEGEKIFHSLLEELNIPYRSTENKIRRFYNEMIKTLE
ncbi:CYTH domain-containing protein [Rossellomorea sp. BNER]|uniref:CYTH domain-containing protein n=1 Tax=Rossellomorea sp. BNER TaxID=2962031 RepID=UPI003AF27E92|nr:CYTH domain-containing protein [Rossellomorea sp. BNER]